MEILRQLQSLGSNQHPRGVLLAMGGGGLLARRGGQLHQGGCGPEIKVIGVETIDADAMTQSLVNAGTSASNLPDGGPVCRRRRR